MDDRDPTMPLTSPTPSARSEREPAISRPAQFRQADAEPIPGDEPVVQPVKMKIEELCFFYGKTQVLNDRKRVV